jgi:hypothetical protein
MAKSHITPTEDGAWMLVQRAERILAKRRKNVKGYQNPGEAGVISWRLRALP